MVRDAYVIAQQMLQMCRLRAGQQTPTKGSGPNNEVPNVFLSAKQTGTGNPQNVAHGLVTTPREVHLFLVDATVGTANSAVQGTHTATNVVCTVSSGAYFYVVAIK
jgi:hypothetical protein